jgi:hypothetical protein
MSRIRRISILLASEKISDPTNKISLTPIATTGIVKGENGVEIAAILAAPPD